MTPTTSPSVCADSIMPRLMNIGPPGSAKALISFTFTGVNEYRNAGLFNSGGAAATSRSPSAIDVALDRGVRDDRIRLADFRRRLLAELHVLLGRVLVLRRRDPGLRERRPAMSVSRNREQSRDALKPAESKR